MGERCRVVVIIAIAMMVGYLSITVQSIQFEVQSGHAKCISEDIKINAMTVGTYSVISPNGATTVPDPHKITVRVTSPYGNNIHLADHVESGNFAFTATEAGDYITCIWAPEHKPSETVTVDFNWKTGVAAKDWSNIAKRGQIDSMQLEFNKLEDTVKSIHEEMFYLRAREEEMQDLNRSTNSRMAWLSFLSLLICLSVAGLQLWHLKTFFERKKLL